MEIPDDEVEREEAYWRYKKNEVFGTPSVLIRHDFAHTLVNEGVSFGSDWLDGVDNLMKSGFNGQDFGEAARTLFEAALPGTYDWHQRTARDPLCIVERNDYSHAPVNTERPVESIDFSTVYHDDYGKTDYTHVEPQESIKHPLNMAFHRFAAVAGSFIALRQPELTVVFGTAEESFTYFNRTGRVTSYLLNNVTSFMKKHSTCSEFMTKSKHIPIKSFPLYTESHKGLVLVTSHPNVIKHRAKFKCSIFAAAADINRYKFDMTNASHVRISKYDKDSIKLIAYDAFKRCKTFTVASTTSDGFVTWYDMLRNDMIWNAKSKWWKDYSGDLATINYFGAKFIRDERDWSPTLLPVNNIPVDGYATEPVTWNPCVGSEMIPIPGNPAIISVTKYGLEAWQIVSPFTVWYIPYANTVEPITCLGSVYSDAQGLKISVMYAEGSAYMNNLNPSHTNFFKELKCIGKPTIDAVYIGWRIATTGFCRDLSPFNLPFSFQNQVNDGVRSVPMAHGLVVASLLTSQISKLAIVNYRAMVSNDLSSSNIDVDYTYNPEYGSEDDLFEADDLAEELYYQEGDVKILKGLGARTAAAALEVLADTDLLLTNPTARGAGTPDDDDYVYQTYSVTSPSYVPDEPLGKRTRAQFNS